MLRFDTDRDCGKFESVLFVTRKAQEQKQKETGCIHRVSFAWLNFIVLI